MLISLDAAEYPFIQLSSDSCETLLKGEAVEVTITLHGVSRKQTINLNLDRDGSEKLVVKGDFSLLQSDFGIQPFSLLNGLLSVKDRLEISVELEARAL
jgi:polyisoprenoid-binding protein YceI